ncbi:MAG: aminopeptidase P N-terminal domain-containing protein [Clostridia bacterium]|nr:aminopeptidase P N-terminal domain-containing protein [Clostridia bacterium]
MKNEYILRRQKLMENKQGPCMACVFSGVAPMRSQDEAYPFSVNRNFYYLTGIDRENMILVLRKSLSGEVSESLYIEPFDEVMAKWVGPRMRAAEATEISGIGAIRDVGNFENEMNSAIEGTRGLGKFHVHLDLWRYRANQADTPAHTFAAKLQQRYPAVSIDELNGDMAAMRAIKSEKELELMRRAQETTRVAIEAMMKHAYPGVNESELEGAFDFALLKQGVRQHAFTSIVAGGARATTLHYSENNCTVEDGQMVLIDLGSAEKNYCADISRTFPVNGKFTERQKEIYNTVLEAQRIVIANAKPGLTTRQLNQMVVDFYETKLDELGLRKEGKTVRDYYYHGVSHGLGLDTHDLSTERERILQPGMVITVEPGLYIEDEGIGVRIENDVVITEDGCVDLSSDILKTVEEIEALMAK